MARLMHTNMVGTLRAADGGIGWGLAFQTIERFGAGGLRTEGAYGWAGHYGTWDTADPKEKLVAILMFQMTPNGTDLQDRFATLVYQALIP
jgi:CubicO group peptidase (beta-lactamase class C family)